jgi:hypothetical protein
MGDVLFGGKWRFQVFGTHNPDRTIPACQDNRYTLSEATQISDLRRL